MSKGPGLFSDFGRLTREILTKDYSTEQKFSVASESIAGVALTSTAVKKGGLSTGDIATQYKYKNATVGLKVDTESNISTTLTLTDVLPSTKAIASWRYPDYNSGKIDIQYLHEHGSFTTAVDLNKSPSLEVSATIGTPYVAFGTDASYKLESGTFIKYNAGVSLTKPNFGGAVVLTDKGDAVKVSYFQHVDQLKKGTIVGEIARKFSTNESTLTVGGSYAVDSLTLVKAKLNNHGNLAILVQHELAPKSFLTIAGNFDTLAMQKLPKFGLSLSLRPSLPAPVAY